MDAKVFDKRNLPSRHTSVGPESAPHRSYYYAMGMTAEEIGRPFVGVCTTWNEAAPCNISLMRQAQAVKKGVKAAKGSPREFTTITVTDGIAMGHQGMKSSLVSREVIADSVELTMRGHCYDALVGLAGCDKSLPGLMMVMLRLNVPAVFMYGGSILPGRYKGRDVTVQDVFEAVGAHSGGSITESELHDIEFVACPSAGSCGGQFTANTMACVSEAIGLALPGSAGAPAPYDSRDAYAVASGEAVMKLIAQGIRPRDIVTRKALENAAMVVAASGGSTNAGLHLPAIAHEAGIDFDLMEVCKVFESTPYIADLKPSGRYVAKDMYEVGGVPVLMKALLEGGYLHGDCLTVTGRTVARNLARVKVPKDQDVIRPTRDPISPTGGVIGLKGNLAPDGAICKVAGMSGLRFSGPARVFDCEEDAYRAVVKRRDQEGRGHRHPLRGSARRPRHARDAVDDRGAVRPGHGRPCGADHRRPVLGRDAGLLRRPRGPRGRGRRPHRAGSRRRRHHPGRRQGAPPGGADQDRARQAPQGLEAAQDRLPVRGLVALRPDRGLHPEGGGDPSGNQGRDPLLR